MQDCERTHRRLGLRGTFRRNPPLIISQYRFVAGLDSDEPLPQGLTLIDVIESILDHEEANSISSGVLRAIAG